METAGTQDAPTAVAVVDPDGVVGVWIKGGMFPELDDAAYTNQPSEVARAGEPPRLITIFKPLGSAYANAWATTMRPVRDAGGTVRAVANWGFDMSAECGARRRLLHPQRGPQRHRPDPGRDQYRPGAGDAPAAGLRPPRRCRPLRRGAARRGAARPGSPGWSATSPVTACTPRRAWVGCVRRSAPCPA